MTTAPIQLTPSQRRLVLDILRARLPASAAFVYGSRARGDARPSSDLDLLVDLGQPLGELLLAQLEQDFSDADLSFRVQVCDGARLQPTFRARIAPDLRPLLDEDGDRASSAGGAPAAA